MAAITALLLKGFYLFLTNLVVTLVGEPMIQWLFFKTAHWFTKKTKTEVDDVFIQKLESEYNDKTK